MIIPRWNHKSTLLAAFCVLMAGLIALTGCASFASSIMFQEASSLPRAKYQPIGGKASLESDVHVKRDVGQVPGIGCGEVTMLGSGGGGWIPAIAIAPTPQDRLHVACHHTLVNFVWR